MSLGMAPSRRARSVNIIPHWTLRYRLPTWLWLP